MRPDLDILRLDINEQPVVQILTTLLQLLHDNGWGQDGPEWLHWGNGNSPYELANAAIEERFGVEHDVEWSEPRQNADGVWQRRHVKSVRVRRSKECCPTCGAQR
jgi:hypothetical protein